MELKVIHLASIDSNKEKIIRKVCSIVVKKLTLPKTITIVLKKLEPAIYAETNLQNMNQYRIVINSDLPLSNIIQPLIHELIHLNQIYTGKLVGKRDRYLWNGIEYKVKNGLSQTYDDYQSMPWELDVNQKLPKLLEFVLSFK
jgi:hypothetical protein